MTKMKSLVMMAGLILLAASSTYGQSDAQLKEREAALKRFFEGKTVGVKIDMPGTSDGVEIVPGASPDIKTDEYRKRLNRYAVALRAGETATITKIKLKDKLIEFQLNGGGYGSDVNVSDYVSPTP